jgi:outer membrane protein TolC
MKPIILLMLCFLGIYEAKSQQSAVLDAYVLDGIAGNRTIKQQNFQVKKALYALDEAKALFRPSVGFNATYSTAQGGRSIAFPVGDLLNPVYSTLNQITRTSAFPQIENVNEQLVPKNFLDYRLKTQMPLLNAEIKYNQQIKQQQTGLQQIEIQIFKKELSKDIKLAYINYLKASQVLMVYDNALKMLQENERVNKSLIDNGMANPLVLMRTKNEIGRINDEKQAAENTRQNAKAYFNFLTNQDYLTDIKVDSIFLKQEIKENIQVGHREELDKLKAAMAINQTVLKMNQAYKTPKIGGILDLGSQGNLTAMNTKGFFALLGVSMDLPLYAGGRNQLKIKQTEMDLASLNEQTIQVEEQFALQATLAKNALLATQKIAASKIGQVATAQRYYQDMSKRYKEGQCSYIELLDAQTQVANTQLQQSISHFDVWLRVFELERVAQNP